MRDNPGVASKQPLGDDDNQVDEETRVLYAALDSFRQYRRAAHYNITHLRRESFYSLPSADIDLLSSPPFELPKHFRAVDDAIDANGEIAEAILEAGNPFSSSSEDGQDSKQNDDNAPPYASFATPSDLDKARSTIRQFYRDWSSEGAFERHASYNPILTALHTHLATTPRSKRHTHSILVPGAGLGRLLIEICALGFTAEGNEVSYHQLLASSWVLNATAGRQGGWPLYPWALNFSNHLSRANQLACVRIPDIDIAAYLSRADEEGAHERPFHERLSMSAGDFASVYAGASSSSSPRSPSSSSAITAGAASGTYAAVVTAFFIDTAPNLITYIDAVHSSLSPSGPGLWINHGPLLWHFEGAPTPAELEAKRAKEKRTGATPGDARTTTESAKGIAQPGSFEVTWEEVLPLVEARGFEILESWVVGGDADLRAAESVEGRPHSVPYVTDPASMLRSEYRTGFFVARRKGCAEFR